MRVIYKYNLNTACTVINDCVKEFLKVDWQDGNGPVIWAEVDTEGKKSMYYILAYGTGWPIGEEETRQFKKYLGTVIEKTPNQYVWHYYLAEAEAEVDNTGTNI